MRNYLEQQFAIKFALEQRYRFAFAVTLYREPSRIVDVLVLRFKNSEGNIVELRIEGREDTAPEEFLTEETHARIALLR